MKKNKNSEIISFEESLINCLMFENTILQKKIKKEQLTKDEEIFDTYLLPPSFLIRQLSKRKKKMK